MELGLDGKVAIVTGGSKGIGRATALGLINEGASVLVCARGQQALDETVSAVGHGARERIDAVAADLMQAEAIRRVVARCVERFGRVDILVNNAGSARPGDFLQLTDEAWMDDWTLKFFGYVRMAREVLPHMQRQKSGVIINVIGAGGLNPTGGYMIGGAANAALNHFTKALADAAAKHGVRVAGINPGPILTERLLKMRAGIAPGSAGQPDEEAFRRMTPLGRIGTAEEVADLVLFLASERGAFIHGANITIDGGTTKGLMG
ncbi:MAG TPA: SDR family NAD(P)-dependent oxidoreductase [Candidatus Binataceae bacterium]|nr:SDR family NAD(P)-dependent oxidoreductase [Candidatus Binataceae bacterium]